MIQIAAFWRRTSKNNRTYYQGKLGNGRLLLFQNQNRKSEKSPDLTLFIVPQPENRGQGQNDRQNNDETWEEDIPF